MLLYTYESIKSNAKISICSKIDQVSLYYLGALSLGFVPTGACYNIAYKYKSGATFERRFTKRTNKNLNDFLTDVNSVVKAMSFGINHRNQGMLCYAMCDLKDFCLKHDRKSIIEYEPITLKERIDKIKNDKK